MGDLVERLRALVIMDEVSSDNPLGRDAAAEIERQAKEIERLRLELIAIRVAALNGEDDALDAIRVATERALYPALHNDALTQGSGSNRVMEK